MFIHKNIKKITAITLIFSNLLIFSACGESKEIPDPETKPNEYLDYISKDAGSSDGNKESEVENIQALSEKIETLMQKTAKTEISYDSIEENSVALSLEWLRLVNLHDNEESYETTKGVLIGLYDKLFSEDKEGGESFVKNILKILSVSYMFNSGNPEVVAMVRQIGENPNKVPFVYDELKTWVKIWAEYTNVIR